MASKWSTGVNAVKASLRFQGKPQNCDDSDFDEVGISCARTFREKKPKQRRSTNTAPIPEEEDPSDANAQYSQPEYPRGENAGYYQTQAHHPSTNLNNNTHYQNSYINTNQSHAASPDWHGRAGQYDAAPQHSQPVHQGYGPPLGQGQYFQNFQNNNNNGSDHDRPAYPGSSYDGASAVYNQGPALEGQGNPHYDARPFEEPQSFQGGWQDQTWTPEPGQIQRSSTIHVAGHSHEYFQRPPEPSLRTAQTWCQNSATQNGGGHFDDIVNSAAARAQRGGQYWDSQQGGPNGNWP